VPAGDELSARLQKLIRQDTIVVDCTATDAVSCTSSRPFHLASALPIFHTSRRASPFFALPAMLKDSLNIGAGVVFANKKVITGE
jgi:hypothetical protein